MADGPVCCWTHCDNPQGRGTWTDINGEALPVCEAHWWGNIDFKRRKLEDAVLTLWAELPAANAITLRSENPRLVEFCQHLHHSIEHQQAMMRTNYWAEVNDRD